MMLLAGTFSAKADQTGLASIHDLRKEHAKLCMSDHFHEGTGNGPSRKAAESSAASSWGSFVSLEYGSDWAHFAYAGSRTQSCKPSAGFWSCEVSGRPCLRRFGAVRSAKVMRARSIHRVRHVKAD